MLRIKSPFRVFGLGVLTFGGNPSNLSGAICDIEVGLSRQSQFKRINSSFEQ